MHNPKTEKIIKLFIINLFILFKLYIYCLINANLYLQIYGLSSIIQCNMRKILCVFLILLLNANLVLAEEYARLYNVRNIDITQAEKLIKPLINIPGFSLTEKNNFYVLENPATNIYHVVVLKSNLSDCYYYYLSNENYDLNTRILESFESRDYDTKRIRNSAFLKLFHSESSEYLQNNPHGIKAVAGGTQMKIPSEYDFSDEAQAQFDNKTSAYTPQIPLTLPQEPVIYLEKPNVLTGSVVHIEAGEQFPVVLSSTISSDSITNNDRISAQLESDWVVNGIKIAPKGSILNGSVTDSRPAQFALGDGRIGMTFDQILTPDGKVIHLTTNEVRVIGDSPRALRIAGRTAGGALGGLLLGALFLIGGADPAQALISGAAVGGAFGAASAIMTKGEDVHVPEGTVLQIMLAEPMTAQPYSEYN